MHYADMLEEAVSLFPSLFSFSLSDSDFVSFSPSMEHTSYFLVVGVAVPQNIGAYFGAKFVLKQRGDANRFQRFTFDYGSGLG